MATVAPTKGKLIIRRGNRQTTTLVPRPIVVVDTREQAPYTFERHMNWVAGVDIRALKTADYSVAGYEDVIAVERKTLPDIVSSLMDGRARFIREMERLAAFRYKCICIEATRTEMKTPYTFASAVKAHPNGIIGSLDAITARYGITIHYGCDRVLSEEFVASYLSKAHAYEYLEANGHGRFLQEGDL
jgi:ERCC4-type nuclease